MVLFREIHVFLQFNWIAQFLTKKAYLHIDKPKLLEFSLQKLTQLSQGYKVVDGPASNIDGFSSERYMLLFNSAE
jgi:hypothetical protein